MRNRSGSAPRAGLRQVLRAALMIMLVMVAADASTALAAPAARTDEQAARQADQAFVSAMHEGDKAGMAALMAQGFAWTDADGQTLDKRQLLQGSAQGAAIGADTKLHDYSTVMFVTESETTSAAHLRSVRVWVKEAGEWRILLGQQTNIEGGSKQEQATVPAGTLCDNPCRKVPYQGTTEQMAVVKSWQALETAVNQRNAEEWARHVGDEFVFNVKENGNPLTKADRVATIRKQAQGNSVTDIGEVAPHSMDVRVFGSTAVMRDTQQPTVHARPYRAMRVWVKREGRWQLVYSQQTTIRR